MNIKDKNIPYNSLPDLPPLGIELESKNILKATISANRYLAELKGYCQKLPNPNLLLNTIILQESKDSSAIENIVTTQDELYKGMLLPFENLGGNVKEVMSYKRAMYAGMEELERTKAFTVSLAVKIMQNIKRSTETLRQVPGTKIMNATTNEIIYFPPDPLHLVNKMYSLEKYLNSNKHQNVDPLIQMALMHYQFESIHPFSDGNGRTGRILNVLFLVHHDLLNLPVLYHSSYIIQNKSDYYRLLRLVTEENNWEEWILFMLRAIEETSISTLQLIKRISNLKLEVLEQIKGIKYKMPSLELCELLFTNPYLKIKLLEEHELGNRNTVSRYLNLLKDNSVVKEFKVGREVYYVNYQLMNLLSNT